MQYSLHNHFSINRSAVDLPAPESPKTSATLPMHVGCKNLSMISLRRKDDRSPETKDHCNSPGQYNMAIDHEIVISTLHLVVEKS